MATRKTKPKTKAQPKKAKAKAQPKKAKAKAQPKKVAAKAQPKKVAAKAQPKRVAAKAQPKKAAAKARSKAPAKAVAFAGNAESALTPEAQRDVPVLSGLHESVATDGLSGFLSKSFDSGGDGAWRGRTIVVAVQALRRAGQARYAELLDRALRILLRPARSGAVTWDDLLASVDPEDELTALGREVSALNESLADAL